MIIIVFKRIVHRDELYSGIKLWNRLYPIYNIRNNLVEQNIFAPFTGIDVCAYGSYWDNELLAFAVTKNLIKPIDNYVDIDQGWISLLVFTGELSYSKKITFLNRVEEELKNKGVKRVTIGGDPQNFIPGIPGDLKDDFLPVLKKSGYRVQESVYDLYQDISNFDYSREIDEILDLKRVNKEEDKYLLTFLQNNFPGRWFYEAQNISRIPGGIQDYWLLWHGKQPVGFVRANTSVSSYQGPNVNWGTRWGDNYCGLGPLGIDSNYRGKGWGLYMLASIITRLKELGYRHLVIDWTELVDYYKKLGFNPLIEYITLSKK